MKMKRKTRNIVMTALLSVALLGCVVAVIWKLIPEGKKFPAFAYDYSTPMKESGDGITIDGKLDETLWEDQRMFEADIKDTTVTYQMTSYYGKSGVYFAFDIQDDAVYYDEGRAIYANSGVEFCVGSPDNTDIVYEIDLNAGGNAMLRKYNGKRYNDWFKDLNSAVWVNGEINTSECKGYTAELYLPYSLFNEENQDIPIDDLVVNPGIVRASSADPMSTDRLWYSIGFEERGIDWMPASPNWYHFDKGGIVARDVEFEENKGGGFDGKKIAFENEIYKFAILPDKNYRYADVTVEGSSVVDNVLFRDGVVYGRKTIEEAKGDTPVVVSAKWVPLSNTKYTISGTVATEEGNIPTDAKLYAVYNGYVEKIKIEKDGSYSATLPEGDYTLYCECNGYMREKKAVSLYQNSTAALVLRKVFLSDEKNAWDLLDLGSGTVVCTKSSWSVSAWHNTLKGNYLYTASDVILPMKDGIDRRVGYSFRDGDKTLTVCLVAENEKNQDRYSVQVIYFDGTKSHWIKSVDTLSKDVVSLADGKGVPFAVLYDNGKLTVWVNHSRVLYEYDATTSTKWTGWKTDTKLVPGITGYSAKDAQLNNLRFNTTGYDGPVSMLDKWILSGADAYDISNIEKGVIVYTANAPSSATESDLMLNFTANAKDDIYVETVVKKGKNFNMADLRMGFDFAGLKLTLKSSEKSGLELQITNWKFWDANYRLNEAQIEAFEKDGIRFGAARIDGVFYMYIQDGNGMDRVITKEYPTLANAVIHPSIATWGGANDAVYSNFVCRVGNNVEPAAPTVPYPVLNGIHYYDVSDLSNGNVTYTYTGSGSKTLEFNAAVGAEDDVYAETILKKGENFDMTDLRLGFAFGKVNLTLLSNTKSGVELQMTDWKFYQAYKLNDVQLEAFEGEGLKVGAARINGIYYMYVQNGDGMDRVVTKEAADYAKESFNIKLATWENAQGAVYSGLNWKIGEDVEPDAPTTPYPVLNGIHYYDVSDLSNGNVTYIYTGSGDKALELNAPVGAQDDVYVEAVLKKVENFNMSDLRLGFRFGSLNLDVVSNTKNGVQLQVTNWKELAYYNFTNAQKEAFEGKGLKVGAARVDGKFRMYIENGNGMDCVLEKEYNAYANSPFNIKLATWDSAKGAVYSGINWKVGESVEPKPSTLVLSGEENYDITNIKNGTVTYTGSGEQVLELNAAVGANDDVYVETVLKKGEDFNMSNLRLGFRFSNLNLDLVSSTKNGLQLQMTNWKEHVYYDFTEEQKQAFEGNGLKIGAARFHGKFYMFIENGNGMECVLEKEYATYAKSSFNVKLVTWTEAKGAVYSNLNWEIGGNTKTESEKNDSSKFNTTAQQTKWVDSGNAGKTTVFIGDSFFDEELFFNTFGTLYQGKDALCMGIGSTTTYDWRNYANGWLGDIQPKNLVVNIGTNNIYDDKDLTVETVMALQDMFAVLKNKMPNTTFYWFGISQRRDTAYADRVTSVNAIMKAWCKENNIVYVETPLVDPTTQTSDGLHPSTACYEQYKLALENAGCVIDVKTASSIPVISGSAYYEIKDRNVTYTYTGSGDKALELDAAVGANDDVYVEAVLKKGENFNMSDLRYGFRFASLNLNVVSSTKSGLQLQMTAWDGQYPAYDFAAAQKTAFEGDGLRIGAARIDGKFYMYIENGNSMDCVLEKEYSKYANSAFNIKLATWQNAQGAVYSDLKWKIGENVAPVASIPVVSGTEYYSVKDGVVTYTYTGSGDKALELDAAVGASDDVYVEAVLKKGNDFNMSDLRYGFRFASLNLNVVSNNTKGLQLQMTAWDGQYPAYNFTAAQKTAFEGDGLRIGAARIDGKFYMYIENGNSMDCVLEKEYSKYANSAFNIKLATWNSAPEAVYSGLKWRIGENVAP